VRKSESPRGMVRDLRLRVGFSQESPVGDGCPELVSTILYLRAWWHVGGQISWLAAFLFSSFVCEFEWWIVILEVVLCEWRDVAADDECCQIWYVGVETWVCGVLDSYATQRAMNKGGGVDCPRATWLCVILFNCFPFVNSCLTPCQRTQ
jgi:hypothetical protein